MIVKLFVSIWDFVTFPIYQAIYKPWEKRKYYLKPKSKCLSQYTTSSQMVFEANEKDGAYYREFVSSNPKTMVDAWKWAVQRNRSKPALGTREILKEEDEVQKNGKIFKKYDLGEYRWLTYEDADYTSDYIGRGLRRTGLEHGEKVCIFADTRAEWLLTAHACFKQGFPIVTLYTNLGEEAVIHGVNETEVTHIITSHELLPKFRSILPNTPKVTHVIYMEHQVERTETKGYPDNVQILAFYEVLHTGKKLVNSSEVDPIPPKETDAAIVMYTSGSTGVPKGVIMSHRNMLSTARGLMQSFDLIPNKNDTYLCFLPLAHVLELLSENMWCLYGVKLGYSSPNT
jgi:long-chain acyl-CoA synthetase